MLTVSALGAIERAHLDRKARILEQFPTFHFEDRHAHAVPALRLVTEIAEQPW